MRIAVVGGSGLSGRYAVESARAAGHDAVAVSRRNGADAYTGVGLAEALAGADVVIDALNCMSLRRSVATGFFSTSSRRLQETASAQGVAHIVTLSILGVERVRGYGYYDAKLAQERAIGAGPVPVTVLRATQFHEFPAQILARFGRGPVAVVPHIRSQPVAARTVGSHLVRLAEERPGGIVGLAGPGVHDIVDLARMIAARAGGRPRILAVPVPGRAGRAMRRGALLAHADTICAGPTFDAWLRTGDLAAVGLTTAH